MKWFTIVLSGILLTSPAVFADDKKVLMLISGYGTPENPDLSYSLQELAQSYLVLHDNGVKVDIATPKGGAVQVKTNKDNLAYIQRFKALATKQLTQTLATSQTDIRSYDGVFIVGGAGAMLDLAADAGTRQMLTKAVEAGLVIAAVCHGVAALADLQLPDGGFFVTGKQVNGFTSIEEQAFSAEHLAEFPFSLQQRLTMRGAHFVHNAPMLPYVALDGTLITAQNPGSVPKAADAMVWKLGLAVAKRVAFADENSMALLSQARSEGPLVIDLALQQQDHNIDINYLALYGFYAYRLANEADKSRELLLMETISKHFSHPEFDALLVTQLLEQGQTERAKKAYQQLLERHPKHQAVAQLKAKLTP